MAQGRRCDPYLLQRFYPHAPVDWLKSKNPQLNPVLRIRRLLEKAANDINLEIGERNGGSLTVSTDLRRCRVCLQ